MIKSNAEALTFHAAVTQCNTKLSGKIAPRQSDLAFILKVP